MSLDSSSHSGHDARVGAALDEFLSLRQRGESISRSEWLRAHPDIADELARHLDILGLISPIDDPIETLLRRGVLQRSADGGCLAEVGLYRITGVLGQGGMGIVLDARHATLNRRVALKFLHPERIGDASAIARFVAEANSQDKLSHPNIVTLIDVFESAGVPVLVMEFVAGCSLDQRIRKEPLSLAAVRSIFTQVMQALEHAHGERVIHRDIKPGNILLSDPLGAAPQAKLADFGLARAETTSGPATNLTATYQIVGTAEYMAPEQVAGGAIDSRVDLYAAGVVLKKLIECANECRQRRALAALARDLTARDPDDRPPSATAVLRRLRGTRCVPAWAQLALTGAGAAAVIASISLASRPAASHWVSCEITNSERTQITLNDSKGGRSVFIPRMMESGGKLSDPLLVTLGDQSQIVFAGCNRGFLPNGGTLVAYNPDGGIRWGPIRIGSTFQWPDCTEDSTVWHVRHLCNGDLGLGGAPEIVIAANHIRDYPACISRVDAATGKVLATFWHCGQFCGVAVFPDLIGPGRPGIVGWGHANLLGGFKDGELHEGELQYGHWDQVWFVVILDPADMNGFGPPPIARTRWPAEPPPVTRLPLAYAMLDVPDDLKRQSRRRQRDDSGYAWPADNCVQIREVAPARVLPNGSAERPALEITLVSRDGECENVATPPLVVDRTLRFLGVLTEPIHQADLGRDVDFWERYWRVIVQNGEYVER
ncbi:MAG: serine/threonine protein kinase [Planctomycetes bacterium]|nr:serine/threonine protein kinase [Planctomycetota bacterium]